MTVAEPIPPPAHIAATAIPPPRRRNSCTGVTSIRAPVSATGCPSEQPLPFTLSGVQVEHLDGGRAHRREGLVDVEQVHVRDRNPSARRRFRCGIDRRQTGDGRMDADGRPDRTVASAGRPSVSLAMVSTAAASLAPQALPAVIEKPSITGCSVLSAASFSMLVSRRGCSSTGVRDREEVDAEFTPPAMTSWSIPARTHAAALTAACPAAQCRLLARPGTWGKARRDGRVAGDHAAAAAALAQDHVVDLRGSRSRAASVTTWWAGSNALVSRGVQFDTRDAAGSQPHNHENSIPSFREYELQQCAVGD
jgi:hypothetical protein